MSERHPLRREQDLHLEAVEGEGVIYDARTFRCHHLNRTSFAVWMRCDGNTDVDKIAARVASEVGVPADEELVWLALRQLARKRLLQAPELRPPGITRRQLLRRLRQAGLVAGLAPAVRTMLAPTAAEASTCKPGGQSCIDGSECCSLVCNGGLCAASLTDLLKR